MNEETASQPTRAFPPEEVAAAIDEVDRELGLRRKLYPCWIKAGNLSRSEAKDRFGRLTRAREFLVSLLPEGYRNEDKDEDYPF